MANGLDLLTPIQQGLQIRGALQQQRQQQNLAPIQQQLAGLQLQQGQLGLETGQAELEQMREQNRLRSIVTGAAQALALPADQRLPFLLQRRQELTQQGTPTMDTDEAIALAQAGDQEGLQAELQETVNLGQQLGLLEAGRQGASPRAFEPRVTAEGELVAPVFDPGTGTLRLESVEGGPSFQTSAQKRQAELDQERKLAEIATDKARETERAKLTEKRSSDLKREFSQRNQSAARQQRILNEALTLAQDASQGLTGAAKLQLSRLLPGIDVEDEAALDSTLKRLAIDQLQNFKGPTTDFEFGVVQSVGGQLGNSRSANIARLKSLQRARFFNEKESEQFNKWIKGNNDPDEFRFNFNEPVETTKGTFTLQDIQDTAVQNNMSIEEVIERLNEVPRDQRGTVEVILGAG